MVSSVLYIGGVAAGMFVATSLVVAAVRWLHMCSPYGRNPGYYFPGRPFFVVAFLMSLVLLPYVLDPESADAWFLTRFHFLPVTLLHFAGLMLSYFGNVMNWRDWRGPMLAIAGPVYLIELAALLLAVWPGEQLDKLVSPEVAACLLYIPGAISTAVCLATLVVVHIWSRRINEDDYSNPNDFPVLMSRRWSLLVVVNTALCWITVVLNDRLVMAAIMMLFAISSVIILVSALNPHRRGEQVRPIETREKPEEEENSDDARRRELSNRRRQEVLSFIHIVVVEQGAFLEPHLTIQDVADRCGYSRSYIAGIIKSEYGGFFDYINNLRLQHVARYHQQHPESTIQEAAEASGFNSRQAYYSVKARLEGKQ